jgi:hypothetical protein
MLVREGLNGLYSKIEVEVDFVKPSKQVHVIEAEMQVGLQISFPLDFAVFCNHFQLN